MITINLIRAQKLLEKFKLPNNNAKKKVRNVYRETEEKRDNILKYPIKTYMTDNDILFDIENQIKAAKDNINNYWIYTEDKRRLHNELIKRNIECGLSEILSTIKLLTEKRNVIKESIEVNHNNVVKLSSIPQIIKTIKTVDEKKEKEIDTNILIEIIDKTELEKEIYGINKKLNELEDIKDKLNATTSLSIEFHPETLKYLGL